MGRHCSCHLGKPVILMLSVEYWSGLNVPLFCKVTLVGGRRRSEGKKAAGRMISAAPLKRNTNVNQNGIPGRRRVPGVKVSGTELGCFLLSRTPWTHLSSFLRDSSFGHTEGPSVTIKTGVQQLEQRGGTSGWVSELPRDAAKRRLSGLPQVPPHCSQRTILRPD